MTRARHLLLLFMLASTSAWVLAAGPEDGVLLLVDEGPTPDAITLTWSGGVTPFLVFRSADPLSFDIPDDYLGGTGAGQWVDVPPAAAIWFYSVQGKTCDVDADCSSGTCVDGVCCDTACDGGCQACNLLGHGGTCTFFEPGRDPDGECLSGQLCDGTGTCVDFDTTLSPGPLSEPIELSRSVAVQAPVAVLDWTIADGGTSDGMPTRVEGLTLRVGGTGDAADHQWTLQGPGADGALGIVSGAAGNQSIGFSPLGIEVADFTSETFALQVQWGANPANTVDQDTFELGLSAEDLTTGTGTQLASSSPVTNGQGLVYVDDFSIAVSGTDAGCAGAGTANVEVTGGQDPISFWWDPIGATTALITDLVPGTYTVTVQEGGGGQLVDSLDLTGVCAQACPRDNVSIGVFAVPSCDGTTWAFPLLGGGESVHLDIEAGKTYDIGTCNAVTSPLELFDTVLTVYSDSEFLIFNDDLEPDCPLDIGLSGVSFISPLSGRIEILVDAYGCQDTTLPREQAQLTVTCYP